VKRGLDQRALTGLDQKEYAAKAGLNRSQLSNWELGTARLSVDAALSLRTLHGLSLDFIFAGDVDSLPMALRTAGMDSLNGKSSD
jgi:transcriptional regulator with XRE-family HTH domain